MKGAFFRGKSLKWEATNPDPDGQAELVAEARKIIDMEIRN